MLKFKINEIYKVKIYNDLEFNGMKLSFTLNIVIIVNYFFAKQPSRAFASVKLCLGWYLDFVEISLPDS